MTNPTIQDASTRSRDGNRLRMLRTLLRRPALSRAELGQVLDLSRATVTAMLGELEQAGMVEQQADDPADDRSRIGRPPLQVSLSASAAYAVGLDFGHDHIRGAVCDLSGRIVAERLIPASVGGHPLASLDLAVMLAQELLATASIDADKVIGIGAGIAVPVDWARTAIHSGGILPGWTEIEPAAELAERLGLPVRIESGANAGAMGEHLFGAGRGVDDMVYVRLSAGVGVGLILGGKPYRGASGFAGELGHITAVEGGLICRCGNRGCVETVVSPRAIADLLSRSLGEPVSVARVLELVRDGDRGARRAVADAGTTIGAMIAATVNLLNPSLVVVGGDLAEAGEVLLEPIRAAVRMRSTVPCSAATNVVLSAHAGRAEVLGAAAIQLDRAPEALARRLSNGAWVASARPT